MLNHNSMNEMFCTISERVLFLLCFGACAFIAQAREYPRLSLTVSARHNNVEVSCNAPTFEIGDAIVVTDKPAVGAFTKSTLFEILPTPESQLFEIQNRSALLNDSDVHEQQSIPKEIWGNRYSKPLFEIKVTSADLWITTPVHFGSVFNHTLEDVNLEADRDCFGYWAYYLNSTGDVMSTTCFQLHPKWMNKMRPDIEYRILRELFIPGTHNSAAFRPRSDLQTRDTIVTKYALSQAYSIKTQLLHGIRYIDLRVGYYPSTHPKFFVNHGIVRLHSLTEILHDIRDFVLATNEIVICDFQEFPMGFGKDLTVHRLLVQLIERTVGDVVANSPLKWRTSLKDIWSSGRTLIIGYDYKAIVEEFPQLLWQSTEHRWGNVQNIRKLKEYLIHQHNTEMPNKARPVTDMAEITPEPWDVLTNRFGGLRSLADSSNKYISKWYASQLGSSANIVAVDFYAGTTIIDSALYWNIKRIQIAPEEAAT